jgi:hypothetical protein
MKQEFWLCLAIVVLAITAPLVQAQSSCTLGTCDGPTDIGFSTLNCTGTPNYYYQRTAGQSSLGNCVPYSFYWVKATCSASDGYLINYYLDNACSVFSFSSYSATGLCIVSDSYSYVTSCNVNDTITAAGTADSSLPLYSPATASCESANNCSSDVTFYYTYYSRAEVCSVANATSSYGFANVTLGTCYFQENLASNVEVSCTQDALIFSYYQNSAGCSGKPTSVSVKTRGCTIDNSSRKKDSSVVYTHQTISCPSVQPPVAAPTPTSSASSIGPMTFAFVMATLALLF